MYKIFLPNIYRSNDLRNKREFDGSIPYYQEFKLGKDNLSLLLKIKTDKIIECLMLYDIVYFDLFELPAVLDQLIQRDEETALKLIGKGKISYISTKDYVFGVKKHKNHINLAAGEGSSKKISNRNDLRDFVEEFFTRNKIISKKGYKKIFRLHYDFNTSYHIDFLNEVNSELKDSANQEKLGITSQNNSYLEKDSGIITAYLEGRRGFYISKNLNFELVYIDDFIREVLYIKYRKVNGVENIVKVNELMTSVDIPDISLMLHLSIISFKDLERLMLSDKYNNFLDWVFSYEDSGNIMKALVKDISKQKKYTSKDLLKNIGVSAVGLINPAAGFLSGILSGVSSKTNIGTEFSSFSDFINLKTSNDSVPLVVTEKYKKYFEEI